ncbi:MAG: 50S ribosomal protein L20 [Candidatus Sungbacteria bacterium]|uniref:Large ribosomal subunit protein bL20 n=1 Tax=Candidatus Sungiibacteriota bacterium TaxID=2750080 RepID=A0A9D6LNU2_9BACT|nr:50S ribosomal protein L20 [Candidatus Sungbacteria bacterium]
MVRVKRGTIAHKKREKLLRYAKGYRWGRKNKERQAREALLHAWTYSFQHRKKKKGEFRALWNAKISAALDGSEVSYSQFIGALGKKKIGLNRKMLATIAEHHPETFKQILAEVART